MGNWFSESIEETFPITIRKRCFWNRDLPDWRDKYALFPPIAQFPKEFDIESKNLFYSLSYPESEHSFLQTVWVICDLFLYEELRNGSVGFDPSALFVYYNYRILVDKLNMNVVPSIRDTIKVLNRIGVCEQKYFNQAGLFEKPSVEAYANAQQYKQIAYKKIKQTLVHLKSAILLKYPVIFGFVYSDPDLFTKGTDKVLNIEDKSNVMKCSGVCILTGFDDLKKSFRVKLGNRKVWFSYTFVLSDCCADFWIIEQNKTDEKNTIAEVIRNYQIREDYIEPVIDENEIEQEKDNNSDISE